MIKVFLEKVLFFVLALAGILFLITVHEFGHWSFSKLFNVATPVFSIGFGPKLASTRIADTEFVLAALPLGGYVSIAGLDTTSRAANTQKSLFTSKPYYQQALIILGGILFNIFFGILALTFAGSTQAKQALNQLLKKLQQSESGGFIGPIGIITLITQSAHKGFSVFLLFLGILSINLAFINLLPIPFLDGGQLLALTVNTYAQLPDATPTRESITAIFLILLILFIIYITIKDIKRLRNY